MSAHFWTLCIKGLREAIGELDEIFPNMDSMNAAKVSPVVLDFLQKHLTWRIYFFQVKKCTDLDCLYHKPLRGDSSINVFPDPVHPEVDGVLHY